MTVREWPGQHSQFLRCLFSRAHKPPFWWWEKCPDGRRSWWSNSVQWLVSKKACFSNKIKKFCVLCISLTRAEQEWTDSVQCYRQTQNTQCQLIVRQNNDHIFLNWNVTRRQFSFCPIQTIKGQPKGKWQKNPFGLRCKEAFCLFGLRC